MALERLDEALRRFHVAEGSYRPGDAASLHRAGAAIHALNDALLEAERAGLEPALLRAKVAGVRALHRRSAFCRRLQDWPRGYPGDWESIDSLLDGVNRTPVEDFGHVLEIARSEAAIHARCERAAIRRDEVHLTRDATGLAWLIEIRKPEATDRRRRSL